MTNKRTTEQILNDAQRALDTAELGYSDFTSGSPRIKFSGLMNLVVFGVSVTCVLQNLRHIEPEFEPWYGPYRTQMESDLLMKYFWNLRSEILKEGKLNIGSHSVINFDTTADFARIPPPPPDVKLKGFFMGDPFGGSGYEIELSDGIIEKYYVNLPRDIYNAQFHFPNPPETHLGENVSDKSVEQMSRMYLDYLHSMVNDAKSTFGINN